MVHTPDSQTASSDQLIYDPGHNLMTMTGNVTVAQGDNVVHGEKLIVDLATGESHFQTGADASVAQGAGNPKPGGRIQVLITPGGGIQQIGGAPATKASAPPNPKSKPAVSASDILVAPDQQN